MTVILGIVVALVATGLIGAAGVDAFLTSGSIKSGAKTLWGLATKDLAKLIGAGALFVLMLYLLAPAVWGWFWGTAADPGKGIDAFAGHRVLISGIILWITVRFLLFREESSKATKTALSRLATLVLVGAIVFELYQDFGGKATEAVSGMVSGADVKLSPVPPPEEAVRKEITVPATGLSQKILIPYHTDVTASWPAEEADWIWSEAGKGKGKWLQFRSKTGREVKGEITW